MLVSKMVNVKTGFKERILHSKTNLLFALSVFWFGFRVIPKPSRITYPCQRTTLTMIFVRIGVGTVAICTSLTKFAEKKLVKILIISILVIEIFFPIMVQAYYMVRYSIVTQGSIQYTVLNHKVIRVHSSVLTSWDFSTGYYWQYIDQSATDSMIEEGVKALTSASDAQTAWQTLMPTYSSGDKVGIKINGNDWWNSDQREIDAIPHVVNSIIKGLGSIGVPENDIYIIENTDPDITWRRIPDYYKNIVTALYPNVVFQYDTNTNPTFGNVAGTEVNFPYSPGTRRINDQIASVDHLILMPIMKAITPMWGVTGSIKLMQGVIEDVSAFHSSLARTTADNPNVLIYQNPHIINKTRLIVGDGLFGAWTGQHFTGGYGGVDYLNSPVDDVPKPWITFDNKAPNCLFFAVDPVAIDCVMYDHILRERNAQDQVAGQTLAPFNEPQLIAGEAAGIGIREHAPYSSIEYMEIDL